MHHVRNADVALAGGRARAPTNSCIGNGGKIPRRKCSQLSGAGWFRRRGDAYRLHAIYEPTVYSYQESGRDCQVGSVALILSPVSLSQTHPEHRPSSHGRQWLSAVGLDDTALAEFGWSSASGATGNYAVVAPCRLQGVLAVEVPKEGRATEDRSGPAGVDPADD